MRSKHIDGNAVDLMAYCDGGGRWELNLYDEIADAMKEGCRGSAGVKLTVGRGMDYRRP